MNEITENKEMIVAYLIPCIKATRAGSDVLTLIYPYGKHERLKIIFKTGASKIVNVEGDSGIAIIKDVIKALE